MSLTHYMESLDDDLLSCEQETELGRRSRCGDREARQELICRNLRLVVYVAKRMRGWGAVRAAGWGMDELVSAGNEGLMRAVDSFDPSRGRFASLAVVAVGRAICTLANREARCRGPLKTDQEGWLESLPDETRPCDDAAIDRVDSERIQELMVILPQRWRAILRMRFYEGRTLKEIADCMGVTKEAIRHNEMRACSLLRLLVEDPEAAAERIRKSRLRSSGWKGAGDVDPKKRPHMRGNPNS